MDCISHLNTVTVLYILHYYSETVGQPKFDRVERSLNIWIIRRLDRRGSTELRGDFLSLPQPNEKKSMTTEFTIHKTTL